MKISVAIQMDPIETINTATDTTYLLALEAKRRNYTVYHYLPGSLSLMDGKLVAKLKKIAFSRKEAGFYTIGKAIKRSMNQFDIILMRQDPPFNMSYITATFLLVIYLCLVFYQQSYSRSKFAGKITSNAFQRYSSRNLDHI